MLTGDRVGVVAKELAPHPNGERGYLEGLASRYADLLCTHFVDVLRHLEELRIRELEDLSPRIRILGGGLGDSGAGAGAEDAPASSSTPSPASPLPPAAAATTAGGGGGSTTGSIGSGSGGEGPEAQTQPQPPPPGAAAGIQAGQQQQQQGDMCLGGLTTSVSQPIYVPGKYSPSSCLSDREEDEIYGFGGGAGGQPTLPGGGGVVPGAAAAMAPPLAAAVDASGYGVFGQRMMQRHRLHRRIVFSPPPPPPVVVTGVAPPGGGGPVHYAPGPPHPSVQLPFQSCLSPRSAYFYEFPPEGGGASGTSKKKTTFSRLLRGLRTHRKDKANSSSQGQQGPGGAAPPSAASVSPRHAIQQPGAQRPNIVPATLLRVGTPDGALETTAVLPPVGDPLDYDRLHYLQVNGGAACVDAASGSMVPTSFEETIQRLKVQEAMRKKERFHKEHEEILRDLRQGLLRVGQGPSGRGMLSADDTTYMYDDDVVVHRNPALEPHWYDEPPYESDPEDFLMGEAGGFGPIYGGIPGSSNGRVCFTLNLRPDQHGQNVISLRSAGDISLPREGGPPVLPPWIARSTLCPRDVCGPGRRHALLIPNQQQQPLPPTPSRRESGDYAGSDVQSVASTLSVETSRSEQEGAGLLSPAAAHRGANHSHHHHKGQDARRHRKKKQSRGGGSGGGGYSSRSTASVSAGSEEGFSASHSSDNEEEREVGGEGGEDDESEGEARGGSKDGPDNGSSSTQQPDSAACSGGSRAGTSFVGRMKGIRQGVQRKISRLRSTQSVDESVAEEEEANARDAKLGDGMLGGSANILGSGSSASDLIKASSAAGFGAVCGKSVQGKEGKRGQKSVGSPSSRHQSPVHNSQTSPARESSRLSNGSADSLSASNSSQAQWTSPNAGCSPSAPMGDGHGGMWSQEIVGMGNAKARAIVDYTPSPYDTDALKFKKGEIIDILAMNASGLWRGHLNGRIGTFKFINVEPVIESRGQWRRGGQSRGGGSERGRPRSVEELLQRINLEEHISVFVLNGYEDLELFKDLEEEDLDYLGICDAEHRAKILTAVELLHDYDSPGSPLSDHGDDGDRGVSGDRVDGDDDEPASSTDGSASHSSSSTSFHSRSRHQHHPCAPQTDRRQAQHCHASPPPPSPPTPVGQGEMEGEGPNDLDWGRHHSWRQRRQMQSATSPSGAPHSAPMRQPSDSRGLGSAELYLPNIPVGVDEELCVRMEGGGPLPGRLAAVIESSGVDVGRGGVGGGEGGGAGDMGSGGRCFSEKSSDSGISSSSRSPPAHPRRGNGSEMASTSSSKAGVQGGGQVVDRKGVMR
ncbi:uncharacterized protein LOC124160425 [Ischnura elegans]|uniref:uncharacterized protein LOC124160425 n=1 Tax=Ischnura elegans TaxID=197161 RepID=UPI001ED87F31|nr:uncharacterized protein LOC124160425 [Ischnura elegans]